LANNRPAAHSILCWTLSLENIRASPLSFRAQRFPQSQMDSSCKEFFSSVEVESYRHTLAILRIVVVRLTVSVLKLHNFHNQPACSMLDTGHIHKRLEQSCFHKPPTRLPSEQFGSSTSSPRFQAVGHLQVTQIFDDKLPESGSFCLLILVS